MKEGWTTRWKALLIWLSGYLSIIAFAVVGGYTIVKSDDEELKRTVKKAFIVTLIFTAISMFFSLYSSIGGMTNDYYLSKAYSAYGIMTNLVTIAEIIVYVTFAAISFFKVAPVVSDKVQVSEPVKKETPNQASRTSEAPAKEESEL